MILYSCGNHNEYDPMEGSTYYWESSGMTLGFKESLIEFRKDTAHILTLGNFTTGRYLYGKYFLNESQDSLVIAIEKDIVKSFNTGTVMFYYEKCGKRYSLPFSDDLKTKDSQNSPLRKITLIAPSMYFQGEPVTITYNLLDSADFKPSSAFNCLKKKKGFNNERFLRDCDD